MIRRSHFSLFILGCLGSLALAYGLYISMGLSKDLNLLILIVVGFILCVWLLVLLFKRKQDVEEDEQISVFTENAEPLKFLNERVHALEVQIASLEKQTSHTHAPDLSKEMALLSELIGHLAETVAQHEALFALYEHDHAVQNASEDELDEKDDTPVEKPHKPSEKTMQHSIEEKQFELFLEPIVTLPQRRIIGYESITRLKMRDGQYTDAQLFLPVARKAGLVPSIEMLQLKRSILMISRLVERGRDTRIYCRLSYETLHDDDVMNWLCNEYENNDLLSKHLILLIEKQVFENVGVVELETLETLEASGCRYALDNMNDLKISYKDLYESGVRFVKISAERLLNAFDKLKSDVHIDDFALLMKRHGLYLVVDDVTSEAQAIELLDLSVSYAQGSLFSAPKPVRMESFLE